MAKKQETKEQTQEIQNLQDEQENQPTREQNQSVQNAQEKVENQENNTEQENSENQPEQNQQEETKQQNQPEPEKEMPNNQPEPEEHKEQVQAENNLISFQELTAKHRLPTWQSAAILRLLDKEDDVCLSEQEFLATLEKLYNRKMGN